MVVTTHPIELVLPPSAVPRSPGVHQSGIIRSIAMETGILKPEWEEDTSLIEPDNAAWWAGLSSDSQHRIAMGLAWEEWYIRTQIPEAIDHPGEMLVDGVYMTPDANELITLILDRRPTYALKLHEVKLTYKSIKTVGQNYDPAWKGYTQEPLTSQWLYMAQSKGYCKGAGTNLLDLHVLFVCGDYSYPIRPRAIRYSIEFDEIEIETNWSLMTEWRNHCLGREN